MFLEREEAIVKLEFLCKLQKIFQYWPLIYVQYQKSKLNIDIFEVINIIENNSNDDKPVSNKAVIQRVPGCWKGNMTAVAEYIIQLTGEDFTDCVAGSGVARYSEGY